MGVVAVSDFPTQSTPVAMGDSCAALTLPGVKND